MKKVFLAFALTAFGILSAADFAFVYRGRINPVGVVMPETVDVVFSLYRDAEGGTAEWTARKTVRPNADGLFQCALSGDGLASAFTNVHARYVGVAVGGGGEQYPRQEVIATPLAEKAVQAESLMAGGMVGTLEASSFSAQTVTFAGVDVRGSLKFDGTNATFTVGQAKFGAGGGSLALKKSPGSVSIFRPAPPESYEFSSLNTDATMFHTDVGGVVTLMSKSPDSWRDSDGVPCVTWAVEAGDVHPPFSVGHPVKVYFYPFGTAN